jgi:excisionase family DNA binding protein
MNSEAKLLEMLFQLNSKMDKVMIALGETNCKSLPEYMGLADAANYICRSKSTLYGLVNRREIAYKKTGKRLLFKRTDLEMWIEKGAKKTVEESLLEADLQMMRSKVNRKETKALAG